MKTAIRKTALVSLLAMASQQAGAITIQFDYSLDTNNFFGSSGSIQRSILESAGAFFAVNINDSLTAITPDANNQFNVEFTHPGTGANNHTIANLNVSADTLIVYAGGRSLSGNTLGEGGPGGFDIPTAQSQAFIDNAASRGQAGALGNVTNRTDFGPWGGTISFDTVGTAWYFDNDLSTDADIANNDFFSVALHELGHLLGIGTADSWFNLIDSNGEFTGAASSGIFGDNVPLSGASHWANGTEGLVNGVAQEAAMDPSILVGTRKVFTDLDRAGLTDVGWEVTAVPIPAAVWLFGSGLIGLVVTSRRRA